MARCVWCEKKIRPGKAVKRELMLSRSEKFKRRNFHKKCWPDFVETVFMKRV